MDIEVIKKQAKDIMDSFVMALEKVKVEDTRVERKKDRRIEGEGEEADSEFRKIMLENAPEKDGDCIIAERGKWVE